MNFKLKNYTTGICWDRTVLEVERMLVEFGATGIMKEYEEYGVVSALSFRIAVDGKWRRGTLRFHRLRDEI